MFNADTTDAWKQQYDSVPDFKVPRGGHVHEDSEATIKLAAHDRVAVEIIVPPVLPRARGRPTKARLNRLLNPKAKATLCPKCGKLTRDHDTRTCAGLSELSDQVVPLRRLKRGSGKSQNSKKGRQPQAEIEGNSDDEQEEFTVGALLENRIKDGQEEVLVHWRGYPSEDDSWEPVSSIDAKIYDKFIAANQNGLDSSVISTKKKKKKKKKKKQQQQQQKIIQENDYVKVCVLGSIIVLFCCSQLQLIN